MNSIIILIGIELIMLKTIKNLSSLAFQAVKLRRSDSRFMEQKSANLILQLLGQEKGMALKIAQMMGSSDEAIKEMKALTEGQSLEAISLDEIGALIQERYQGKVDEIFVRVDEASWVASLGQVHKCRLKKYEGQFVLKILYPGIKKKLEDQLKLLGLFGQIGSKTKLRKWGFDISDYLNNFQRSLEIETDYLNEIKNLKLFHEFNQKREVIYPEVIEEYSTSELLITSLVPGITIESFKKLAEPKTKRKFNKNFLMLYLRQLLKDGFVQGDTHQGNFYIHQDTPVFLDFGHFLSLTEIERKALRRIFAGLVFQNHEGLIDQLVELGFERKKIELVEDKLPMFITCIFRPFIENKIFDTSNWEPRKDIDALLGEDKWWVRSSGDARFFQLIRSFWGIYLLIKNVHGSINWHMCALEILGEVDPSLLNLKPSHKLDLKNTKESFLSTALKVQVFKKEVLAVDLTFPARSVFSIGDLIDSSTLSKLEKRKIDLNEIQANAIKNQLSPGILFELEDDEKTFKVFLQ